MESLWGKAEWWCGEMFSGFAKVSVSNDKEKDFLKGLNELSKVDVLVGVPEDTSSRPGKINNAELVYIHTHGIRTRAMRQEMGEIMAMGNNNMPFSPGYEQFSDNLSRGMPYSAAFQMYLQEHGSPAWQSPPRPVIEPAIEDPENKKRIAEQLKQVITDALDGDTNIMKADLNGAGMVAQNAVRDWFTNPKNEWAPNSPLTVKRKGSDRPLIDTGELRKSISYVVREK